MSPEMSYEKYLHLDQILNAQHLASNNEHDEMLFIVIHQVYELWFKQILHEMNYFTQNLKSNKLPQCGATLGRVLKILKTLVAQLDVLETLTPLNYSTFRDQLQSSSGFQSLQFRKFEFFLGFKNKNLLRFFENQPHIHSELTKALNEPALYDYVLQYLKSNDFAIPQKILDRDYSQPIKSSDELQNIILDIYHNHSELANLIEKLVDLDEGIQEWRYRHVKMVERTIGNKSGTGGSSGAEYLKSTLFLSFFEDLWLVRNKF